ncbi:DNA-processing protein DprA [Acidobacteriota bacterium]
MEENIKYWIALNLVLAENLKAAHKITKRFPNLLGAFNASRKELVALGVEEEIANALTSQEILDQASREIERLRRKKIRIITLEDKDYPSFLREIFDPPCVLYCAGEVAALKEPAVSIVGARQPTPYGRAVAERLALDLASRGIVVVSGLARGIDSIGHWGALKGGKTVAVLGSGLENIYPKENMKLFERIIEDGAVISEFPLESPPLGFHFPLRNRIISGLSHALIVVEAAKKSGSLISARLALEQNREVMAVPGKITSSLSKGTNWLIKNGAKLVEGWEDVAEDLSSPLREQLLSQKGEQIENSPSMNHQEEKIFGLLRPDSEIHIDELVEKSEFSISEMLSILLKLEIKGLISQRPGKYFQRKWQ